MTPKEQLDNYAARHGAKTEEEIENFIGQAASLKGLTIFRTSSSRIVCQIKREGRTIIVTETTITNRDEIRDGKIVAAEPIRETTEILRIEL